MPLLGRTTRKLLSTVNGKRHATQDDHQDTLPTPPPSNSTRPSVQNALSVELEDDITRDPESSDNEAPVIAQSDGPPEFQLPSKKFSARHTISEAPTFQSPASLGGKRSNASDEPSSDGEDAIFGSQGQKRQRTLNSKNIHAQTSQPKSKPFVYGKSGKQQSPKKSKDARLKEAKKQKAQESAPMPVFKQAKGADMFFFKGADPRPEFKAPKSSGDMPPSGSPSLSSLSSAPGSPEVDEIDALELPDAQPYVAKTDCTICGQTVDKFFREDFENENEFAPGKRMSYKWQQRFCRYHKRRKAEDLRKEKGYPEIDWKGLDGRMLKLHSHLEGILNGNKSSYYREELAERLKGGAKTALQAVRSDDAKGGAPVGYYGPRGEKAMTDHIIAHLSDKLRKQAAKDKLVAAAGISGGVSGFIQTVLVPELATKLVQEDLKVSEARAREVIAESAELGELLNPEIAEKVDDAARKDEDEDD